MAKLLELMVLFALVAIPARAAREPDPRVGLRRALRHAVYFNLFYLLIAMFVWGRFVN
jgi:hypothetical protein